MIGFTISLSAINIQNIKHIFAAQSRRSFFNGLSLGFHVGEAVFLSHCVIPRSSISYVFLNDFFESF